MKKWLCLAGLTGIDLGLKRVIEKKLPQHEKKYMMRNKLLIRKHHNDGAIFDSLPAKKSVVYAVSYAMIGFFTGRFLTEQNGVKKAGLLLILSGALSNAIDRLQFGYVIDYFTILYGKLKRIIFNLGDFFVFAGMLLWGLAELFDGSRRKKRTRLVPEQRAELFGQDVKEPVRTIK